MQNAWPISKERPAALEKREIPVFAQGGKTRPLAGGAQRRCGARAQRLFGLCFGAAAAHGKNDLAQVRRKTGNVFGGFAKGGHSL